MSKFGKTIFLLIIILIVGGPICVVAEEPPLTPNEAIGWPIKKFRYHVINQWMPDPITVTTEGQEAGGFVFDEKVLTYEKVVVQKDGKQRNHYIAKPREHTKDNLRNFIDVDTWDLDKKIWAGSFTQARINQSGHPFSASYMEFSSGGVKTITSCSPVEYTVGRDIFRCGTYNRKICEWFTNEVAPFRGGKSEGHRFVSTARHEFCGHFAKMAMPAALIAEANEESQRAIEAIQKHMGTQVQNVKMPEFTSYNLDFQAQLRNPNTKGRDPAKDIMVTRDFLKYMNTIGSSCTRPDVYTTEAE